MSDAPFVGGSPADRAAIARLHAADEAAARAQDYATLRRLMSDEAVVLAPGAPPLAGMAALDRALGAARPGPPVLAYRFDWAEVRIEASLAVEWGHLVGAREGEGGVAEPETYKLLRVLRREGGEWRVFRTIWNDAPAS